MNEKLNYPSHGGKLCRLWRKLKITAFLLCVFAIHIIAVPDTDSNYESQPIQIKGKVIDSESKIGLPGVNVVVKGTITGAITDIDGEFTLSVPDNNAILTCSFIGYVSQDIPVKGQSYINVSLLSDLKALEEVVVVGFGTARKENLTGAISNIKTKEILTTTHTSLAQSLEGKIAGLQIRQNSGEPGSFDESINIRGFGAPLYVIDGIVRGSGSDFQKLNPEDIESISVLKDASAAIFGINANNGVIIVTTKRGAKGKAKFRLNTVWGIQSPTNVVEMSNASQFMDIRNDADVNTGKTAYLVKSELDKYHDGTYPSTNWYDETFNKNAVIQNTTFSAEGGNDFISYFTSFGYQNEGSILKSGDMFYKKYTFRSNLTANFTRNLVAQIDIYGRTDEQYQPGDNFFNIFKGTRVSLPTDKVYANDDPDHLGNVYYNQHPVALSTESITGFTSNKNKAFYSTATLTYLVPFVKGLKIKGLAAYDSNNGINKSVDKAYKTYSYDLGTLTYTPNTLRSPSNIWNGWGDSNTLTFQAQLLYSTKIADVHNIGATIVYEQKKGWSRNATLSRDYAFYTNDQINQAATSNQQTTGSESEFASISYLGRFTYDYKSKYLVEFAARYDGSYRYHPDRRWGFFPVLSGGWRLSEENFIKDNVAFLSNLKLRASYGLVGQDAGNPFQYLRGFSTSGGGGYEFNDGTFTAGASAPSIINEKLTWITSRIADIGIEFGFFKGKLNGEFDVYQRDRDGLLATRAVSLPNTFGATLPEENLNGDRVRGFDFSLEHNNNIGDFSYSVKANFNFARSMKLYIEKAPSTSSWDRWRNDTTNRWSDVTWAYNYIGQFQSMEEVVNYAVQNGGQGNIKEMPGDYKFKDVNNDGVIDDNDMKPIFWNATPKFHYGINLSARWKGFDFYALFQGSGKYTVRFKEVYAQVMCFNGNTPAYFWDRWHLADPYDPASAWVAGKYPPSRFNGDVGSMYKESDRWIYDASYLRFKNLELGYTFSPAAFKKAGLNSIRVYANAHNIFTIANEFVKPFDPEKLEGSYSAGFTYPLTRSFNLGINISF